MLLRTACNKGQGNGLSLIHISRVAKKYRKPVIGIAGSLTHDVGVVHQHGIDAVFSVLTLSLIHI